MSWVDDAVKLVRDYDRSRPRSRQRAIGWSEAGGCRAAIGYQLDGAFAEDTDTWAAQRGTAIHEYALPILAMAMPGARTEVLTSYRGIPGHADLVDSTSVTDAKTTTLANSKLWAGDHELLKPKRIQAHGYAAGLVDAGELPEDCTVRIMVIPVDGTFTDWWAYEEPFDRALADEGADTVDWVAERLAAGLPLPKDKHYSFCETWCGFFSLCRSPEEANEAGEITDPEVAAAVAAYGKANALWSAAEKEKKLYAPKIRGFSGHTADGWRVSTSPPGDDGEAPDMGAIAAHYREAGIELPMTRKPGSSPRLSVTRLKTVKQ